MLAPVLSKNKRGLDGLRNQDLKTLYSIFPFFLTSRGVKKYLLSVTAAGNKKVIPQDDFINYGPFRDLLFGVRHDGHAEANVLN